MDTLSVALSGVHAASVALDAAAHNVANLNTEQVRPLEVVQEERPFGGAGARVAQATSPRPVGAVHEVVDQLRASYQYTASLRILAVEDDLHGQLIDSLA